MLPKRDIKLKKQHSTTPFDKGKQIVSKNNSVKKKQNSIFFILFLFAIISLFVVSAVLSIYSFIKVKKFNTSLAGSISQLSTSCKSYETSKVLNSLLLVTLDSNKNFKNIDYIVYDREKLVKVNFNDAEFDVDKGGTKGNIKTYVDLNNIYLNDDKIFSNLTSLFLRVFYLKVDHVIVTNEVFDLKDYISKNNSSFLLKIKNSNISQVHDIKTDICPASISDFTKDFSSDNRAQQESKYSNGFKVTDYFYFGDIRKEQIRIHLNNCTGVDNWGFFISNLLGNYGLNVVKLDTNSEVKIKSQIYIDDDSLRQSGTVEQILYLVDNLGLKSELQKKNSIYSDIYIDIGQDWLVQ